MNMSSIASEHPSITEKQQWILTALDRCDKCQAQALVQVIGKTGDLLFCGHHYNAIVDNAVGYDKIMKFMVEIIDERDKLAVQQ